MTTTAKTAAVVERLRAQVRELREKLAEMRELRDYASRDAKAARKERDALDRFARALEDRLGERARRA